MNYFLKLVSIAQFENIHWRARNDTLRLIFNATSDLVANVQSQKSIKEPTPSRLHTDRAFRCQLSYDWSLMLIYPEFESLTVTQHFGEYEGVN
jgi:hypothetical protein